MIPRYLMAALRVHSDEDVPRVSRSEGLRPDRLRLWAKATKEFPLDPGHPMFAWRRIADLGAEPTARAVEGRWRETQAQTRAARHIATRCGTTSSWPTSDERDSGTGSSRTRRSARSPLRPGEVLLGVESARAVATIARGGAWRHSGQLSRRLQGTLRSPSFSIDRRYLHVLAAGKASRVNVVIEHFVMIQDPLYGRLRLILNDDNPRWHTFDLEMWRGRRCYLEFADTTTQDLHDMGPPAGCGPDGYVAVGDVCLSDQGPPGLPSTGAAIGLLGDAPVDSPRASPSVMALAVSESLAALADGSLPDRSDAEPRSALLAWLLEAVCWNSTRRRQDGWARCSRPSGRSKADSPIPGAPRP